MYTEIVFKDSNNVELNFTEAVSGKAVIYAAIDGSVGSGGTSGGSGTTSKTDSPVFTSASSVNETETIDITITNFASNLVYTYEMYQSNGTTVATGWTDSGIIDGKITFTSPDVTGDTNYVFKITAQESGKTISDPVSKVIQVKDSTAPSNTWELTFNLGNAVSEILINNISGYNSTTHAFTLEDMYGQDLAGMNPKIELYFCGWVGNPQPETVMPKTVFKDMGIETRPTPTNCLDQSWDFDFETKYIKFPTGSPSTKVYKLKKVA